jgi:PEGA domain-containing protein
MNFKRLDGRVGAVALAFILGPLAHAGDVAAQTAQGVESPSVSRAGAHFRRGVELYGEANYAGALVEFKRAYALVPSSAALYDLGEAQFQLQDYAGALQTFRRFLSEFGPGEGHRAEVEANVALLAARVGHLNVTTIPGGADITIDDEPVGKTPLGASILVSVGHRKVVASMAGIPPVTRFIDVAAGEEVAMAIALPTPVEAPVSPLTPEPKAATAATWHTHVSPTVRWAGWITTAALAAGGATLGILAIHEAGVLGQARRGLTTSATLTHDANLTGSYAVVADSLGAAAIVAGAISLVWTLSAAPDGQPVGAGPAAHLAVGPTAVRFEMTF